MLIPGKFLLVMVRKVRVKWNGVQSQISWEFIKIQADKIEFFFHMR